MVSAISFFFNCKIYIAMQIFSIASGLVFLSLLEYVSGRIKMISRIVGIDSDFGCLDITLPVVRHP